ncbi:hypothetical protein A2115_00190 [Candidatus Woesebacteria bacterium GWA1_41_8]|uniref:UDP-N-acetylglucosamine--N-acetylmuramyl-(pentapeptide) pyrophosphoryl-undecaprenol N-acetylglucosamine transferase n=1 Tax=Candidatus Woesebacteria bacterium GWA1_41_8 TaxID=1802471 RepID=A0A1F7WHI1_9BACT|nr:MAG: hypothetical protein A2115_00190 [Candidatus Woesebacteria bacterium GWA1_41_8]
MQEAKPIKILLTGGHAATTAISVVEELIRRQKSFPSEIYWIGAKAAVEGKALAPLEASVFPGLGVSTHTIPAGRLQRRFSLYTIPSLAKIPWGFFKALGLVERISPDIILSFGAYAAFPVVLAGWLKGIPVVLHEQTVTAGLANRLSSPFASKIALADRGSLRFFPKGKCVLVGNPIMTQIAEIEPKKTLSIPPTILVIGGSRGSSTINGLVEPILERLLGDYVLIHLTGSLDFEKFKEKRNTLPKALRLRYEVFSQIDPMQMDGVYKRADILVGRSGANTVSEILTIKIPSILIPIPFSYRDEQTKNAKAAQKVGIAKLISQDEVTSEMLFEEVKKSVSGWNKIIERAAAYKSFDKGASSRLVDLVFTKVR